MLYHRIFLSTASMHLSASWSSKLNEGSMKHSREYGWDGKKGYIRHTRCQGSIRALTSVHTFTIMASSDPSWIDGWGLQLAWELGIYLLINKTGFFICGFIFHNNGICSQYKALNHHWGWHANFSLFKHNIYGSCINNSTEMFCFCIRIL